MTLTSTIWEGNELGVYTKTFYAGIGSEYSLSETDIAGRLRAMDEEIDEWIFQNHNRHPDTKIKITSAMGERVYVVTVVITQPEDVGEEEKEDEHREGK